MPRPPITLASTMESAAVGPEIMCQELPNSAATVAAMDYGDLWICVGDCNGKLPEPPALIAEGE